MVERLSELSGPWVSKHGEGQDAVAVPVGTVVLHERFEAGRDHDLAALHAAPEFPGASHATLLFVCDRDRVLLIRKRRGHGAGFVNAPGGKLECGESLLACALRETREEVGVIAQGARLMGELRFQDVSGERVHGWVFLAARHLGEPVATAEAVPFWCARDQIPYAEMWPGDRFWLPWLLADRRFRASLLCRGEAVLEVLLSLDDPD